MYIKSKKEVHRETGRGKDIYHTSEIDKNNMYDVRRLRGIGNTGQQWRFQHNFTKDFCQDACKRPSHIGFESIHS